MIEGSNPVSSPALFERPTRKSMNLRDVLKAKAVGDSILIVHGPSQKAAEYRVGNPPRAIDLTEPTQKTLLPWRHVGGKSMRIL